jgi:hypothetical protein
MIIDVLIVMKSNYMHYLSLVYFINQPVQVSGMLIAHHQEVFTVYRVFQEESAILWEMIVCVILSKKVHMNMGLILNGY